MSTARDRATEWVHKHLAKNTSTTRAKAHEAFLAGWIQGRVALRGELQESQQQGYLQRTLHAEEPAAAEPRPTGYDMGGYDGTRPAREPLQEVDAQIDALAYYKPWHEDDD